MVIQPSVRDLLFNSLLCLRTYGKYLKIVRTDNFIHEKLK